MANGNSVIFIHPDGASPSHFAAGRFVQEGPDGRLNWDNMTNAGVYLGHMADRLVGTSNAGAVTHATGVKVFAGSYGLDEEGNPVESLSALSPELGGPDLGVEPGMTIMEEAIEAGKATAIINSGLIAEPGTGVFLADVENRRETEEITAQIIESGANVILGAGETDYLPMGTIGFFGEEGTREDGRNLIEEAEAMGYTVVFTQEELLNVSPDTEKLLGIFAAEDTYNDTTEEANQAAGLDNYGQFFPDGTPTNPPSVAQMLEVTLGLDVFTENQFMIVLEEEGADNFPNNNNARGAVDATLRADEAIGVAIDFIENIDPNTLLITAADSDASGLEVDDVSPDQPVGSLGVNPTLADRSDAVRNPLDGTEGLGTDPFVSAPDLDGDQFSFGIAFTGTSDYAGSIVSKAHGLNADLLPSTVDNTEIYEIMYRTLFGDVLPELIDGTPENEVLVGEAEDNLIRADIGDDTVAGGAGNDLIYGEEGDDILRGDANRRSPGNYEDGNDTISGGTGDDRIGGKGGDDNLYGDEGDDSIWGDDGDDLIRGGLGNDVITGDDFSGGQGSDTFILAVGEGTDTIVDFEVGTDFIGLADGLTFTDLSFTGNSIISGEETLAILNGIDTTALTESDFTSV